MRFQVSASMAFLFSYFSSSSDFGCTYSTKTSKDIHLLTRRVHFLVQFYYICNVHETYFKIRRVVCDLGRLHIEHYIMKADSNLHHSVYFDSGVLGPVVSRCPQLNNISIDHTVYPANMSPACSYQYANDMHLLRGNLEASPYIISSNVQ